MRGVLAYMRNLAQLQKYAGVFPGQLWNAAVLWFQEIIIVSHTHVLFTRMDDRGVLCNESGHSITRAAVESITDIKGWHLLFSPNRVLNSVLNW